MKVTISKESKKVLTLEEASIAKSIINDMREYDFTTVEDCAKQAASLVNEKHHLGCIGKVISASATIAHNRRVWNRFTENSGNLDVLIECTVMMESAGMVSGFYTISAMLTDLWDIDITGENHDEIRSRMYVRTFVEK